MLYDSRTETTFKGLEDVFTGGSSDKVVPVVGSTPLSTGRIFIKPSKFLRQDGSERAEKVYVREHSKYSGIWTGFYDAAFPSTTYFNMRNVIGTYEESTDTFHIINECPEVGTYDRVDTYHYMILTDTTIGFMRSDGSRSVVLTELEAIQGSFLDVQDKTTLGAVDFSAVIGYYRSNTAQTEYYSAGQPFLSTKTNIVPVYPNGIGDVVYQPSTNSYANFNATTQVSSRNYPQTLPDGSLGMMLHEIPYTADNDVGQAVKFSDIKISSTCYATNRGKTVRDAEGDDWFLIDATSNSSQVLAVRGV